MRPQHTLLQPEQNNIAKVHLYSPKRRTKIHPFWASTSQCCESSRQPPSLDIARLINPPSTTASRSSKAIYIYIYMKRRLTENKRNTTKTTLPFRKKNVCVCICICICISFCWFLRLKCKCYTLVNKIHNEFPAPKPDCRLDSTNWGLQQNPVAVQFADDPDAIRRESVK